MLKKLFIISASLFLIVLIVFGVYKFIGKSEETGSTNTNIQNNNSNSGNNGEGGVASEHIINFSDEPVLGPTLTYDTNAVKYYHKDTGNVYQNILDGSSKKTVSSAVLKDLLDAKWSPSKDQVITVYKDLNYPHQKKFILFDYNTQKATPLHKNVSDVTWLSSGTQIAYHYFDLESNTGNISISMPDGSGWKKILDLNIRDVVIQGVPEQSKVSFQLKPTAYRESSLQTISTLGGNPTTVVSDKFGLDAKWSPDGTKALVSVTRERGSSDTTLAIVDIAKNYKFEELDIPTMASKAIWSEDGKYIYYALPETIPDNAVIPDEYINKSIRTADTFWRYDVRDKKKEQLTFKDDSDIVYDAISLFPASYKGQLFFVNRDDGKLYYVEL